MSCEVQGKDTSSQHTTFYIISFLFKAFFLSFVWHNREANKPSYFLYSSTLQTNSINNNVNKFSYYHNCIIFYHTCILIFLDFKMFHIFNRINFTWSSKERSQAKLLKTNSTKYLSHTLFYKVNIELKRINFYIPYSW